MSAHEIPLWIRTAKVIEKRCDTCRSQLRYDDANGEFCFACWDWNTRLTIERCRASAAARKAELERAAEKLMDDDTQGYLYYSYTSAADHDWQAVLHYKWRIAVLEMTGKRLPFGASEPDQQAA